MADNGSFRMKERLRASTARNLAPDDRVLEFYAGGGRLYEACWSQAYGATMDKDAVKAREAAITRPRWAVGCGDSIRAISGGWLAHVPFRVVDIDAWGEPWGALHAWCHSARERAPVTTLFLTDGYRSQCNMAARCRALWGKGDNRNVTPAEYQQAVATRLREWGAVAGVEFTILTERRHARMFGYELAARRLA